MNTTKERVEKTKSKRINNKEYDFAFGEEIISNNSVYPNSQRATQDDRYYQRNDSGYGYNQYSNNNAMVIDSYYQNTVEKLGHIPLNKSAVKKVKQFKKVRPRIVALVGVYIGLFVLVCSMLLINTIPANAEAMPKYDTIINEGAVDSNIKSTIIANGVVTFPKNDNSKSNNWFDKLCDWLSNK